MKVNTPELIGQRFRGRVTMLRLSGSSGRDSSEEASTIQTGSVAFPLGQCTIPQLHPCHYLTKKGIKTVPHPPYNPDLALCDFCLFPKLRGFRYKTFEEMKEYVTKVIDTLTEEDFHGAFQKLLEGTTALQSEEITSKGSRVSCVYYQ